MTFSIVGRCRRSGMLGVAVATSSICVGARCPHVRAGVGAAATQNITDPALGPAVLDKLESGLDARNGLRETLDNRPHPDYRQVIVIDHRGNTACHSGRRILGIHAESSGSNCHAAGNLLADEAVIADIVRGFERHGNDHLAERLLKAIESGLAGGGEQGEVHSAALLVADAHPFPLVDLRVDWHDHDPVGALRELWHAYRPQMGDYLLRASDPASAPAYGVSGDP